MRYEKHHTCWVYYIGASALIAYMLPVYQQTVKFFFQKNEEMLDRVFFSSVERLVGSPSDFIVNGKVFREGKWIPQADAKKQHKK